MVAAWGVGLGALAIVVGIATPFVVEWLKNPRLEVVPQRWEAEGPIYPMTFASAMVRNKPIRGPVGKILNRSPANACEITITFYRWAGPESREKLFAPICGRWDSHEQPWRPQYEVEPDQPLGQLPAGETPRVQVRLKGYMYDQSLVQPQEDISVGSDRGRISVAILRDSNAFGFSDLSYRDGQPSGSMCKPQWKLDKGTYRVEISVQGSNASCFAVFKLEYLTTVFTDFRLQPVRE
jgi:hypothetical protein